MALMIDPDDIAAASQEEIAVLAADLLERLPPGRLPKVVFDQVVPSVVWSTVDIAPFMHVAGVTKVLLGKRPADDQWWPGAWHMSGVILLPTDEQENKHDYAPIVDRSLDKDFQQTIRRTGPVRIVDVERRRDNRGDEQTAIAIADVAPVESETDVIGGAFFNIADVLQSDPEEWGLLPHLKDTLANAHRAYLESPVFGGAEPKLGYD